MKKVKLEFEIDGWRWTGFFTSMLGVFVLGSADASIQWIGWAVVILSSAIWAWMGIKDKDTPRALMEFCYIFLAMKGSWEWWNWVPSNG